MLTVDLVSYVIKCLLFLIQVSVFNAHNLQRWFVSLVLPKTAERFINVFFNEMWTYVYIRSVTLCYISFLKPKRNL